MQDNPTEDFLDILLGEKLSSVTFVMDYLQIDFDGNRFTFNVWPVVTVNKTSFKFGDALYRDKLCSLIAKNVTGVTYTDKQKIEIEFDNNDKVLLSLNPNNPEIVTPEIADFTDTNGRWYVFQ